METTIYKSLTDYCKDVITENIENYSIASVYACDLGDALTEGMRADGTCTYSTYEAKKYLQEWWDEAAEYHEYEKFNFGEVLNNPFESPERYMVCMVNQGVRSLLAQSDFIDKKWNDKITLSKRNIKRILKQIEDKKVEF